MDTRTSWLSKIVLVVVVLITFTLLIPVIDAAPTPRTVTGRIMSSGFLLGVSNGYPVIINVSSTPSVIYTSTNAPNDPNLLGTYSGSPLANVNDLVVVTSWNATNWGRNSTPIRGGTTTLHVQLNGTRRGEANITRVSPSNNTRIHAGRPINISVNITWEGYNGTRCSGNSTLSNASIILYNGSSTSGIDLGNVSYNQNTYILWNFTANKTGTLNATVSGICLDTQEYFTYKYVAVISNLTIFDNTTPIITLYNPPNNSFQPNNTMITFQYIVNDDLPILNCSFIVNGIVNLTNQSTTRGSMQSFNQNFSEDNYSWSINCTDTSDTPNTGTGGISFINVTNIAAFGPIVTAISVLNPIELLPNASVLVQCNATVYDFSGSADIVGLNATLYHYSSSLGAPDDNNTHYTNTSCVNISSGEFDKNFTCAFTVSYFANASGWNCSVQSSDTSGNRVTNITPTNISQLMALAVSPVIDYGFLAPGNTSEFDTNVTITNLGNMPFNISTYGFALFPGDNLSMDCTLGNVSVWYQRYAAAPATAYTSMTPLNGTSTVIDSFIIPQRTDDSGYGTDQDTLYWKLQLPAGVGGRCNGTVVFAATSVE